MHPRDMFLAEEGATDLNSTDHEFALSWYRRGVARERNKVATLQKELERCESALRLASNLADYYKTATIIAAQTRCQNCKDNTNEANESVI